MTKSPYGNFDPKAKDERIKIPKGPRYSAFDPQDNLREDIEPNDLAERLEKYARGYTGQLRIYLCTAAELIRSQQRTIREMEGAVEAIEKMTEAVEAEKKLLADIKGVGEGVVTVTEFE